VFLIFCFEILDELITLTYRLKEVLFWCLH